MEFPSHFLAIEGKGIEAKVNGRQVLLGNAQLMQERDIPFSKLSLFAEKLAGEAKTPIFVALDNRAAGLIAVADSVKEGALPALKKLKSFGLSC